MQIKIANYRHDITKQFLILQLDNTIKCSITLKKKCMLSHSNNWRNFATISNTAPCRNPPTIFSIQLNNNYFFTKSSARISVISLFLFECFLIFKHQNKKFIVTRWHYYSPLARARCGSEKFRHYNVIKRFAKHHQEEVFEVFLGSQSRWKH